MASSLFFDLGGVCLTDAWDTAARIGAAEAFNLEPGETDSRHNRISEEFECGRMTLDDYLDDVIFHVPRPFERSEFWEFMKARSQPHFSSLQVVRGLKTSGRYFLGVINNESRELNRYRIDSFGLGELFDLFVSSCYAGTRKPSRGIYRLALDVSNRDPADCIFLDDRAENIEVAQDMGFGTIHVERPELLESQLRARGVEW